MSTQGVEILTDDQPPEVVCDVSTDPDGLAMGLFGTDTQVMGVTELAKELFEAVRQNPDGTELAEKFFEAVRQNPDVTELA
ncbi:hypothetical protein KC685_04815, partial [Candidatus Dojkabacteria bacterium]|nr:hypothetical protein [Candidatus Dojkabacteria bacterium]